MRHGARGQVADKLNRYASHKSRKASLLPLKEQKAEVKADLQYNTISFRIQISTLPHISVDFGM